MSNKPIESFYAGNIEVAIWENQGEGSKTFHTVTAKRTYMDANGEWRDAGSVYLLAQQIPGMILALQKSHEHLRMQGNSAIHEPSVRDDPVDPAGSANLPANAVLTMRSFNDRKPNVSLTCSRISD